MIIALLLPVLILITIAVARHSASTGPCDDGWWGWVTAAVVFGMGWLLGLCVLLGYEIRIQNELLRLEEIIPIYEARAEALSETFRTELLKYPEHEKEVYDKITPANLSFYAARYPELKTSGVLVALGQKILSLQDKRYQCELQIKEQRMYQRIYRWWLYFGGGKRND